MELVLATRNSDKIREIKHILREMEVTFLTFRDFLDFPHTRETGVTLEENALIKARDICRFTGKFTLADDSGLEVNALSGIPGVFSSRFAGPQATYEDNNEKLLSLLRGVPEERRGAQFRCVIALIDPWGKEKVGEGICPGRILSQFRGSNGFGYDPLFQPLGFNNTFAQMDIKEKNQISHRFQALQKAKLIIQNWPELPGK